MPLQNRVTPFGELIADPARGTFMGNRGGRFHRPDRTLGHRRFVSKQWICCALDFKSRQREIWSNGYTELFFLDEVTALAAGHRPCFECRRADANAFAQAWERACEHRPRAAEMDVVLHAERLAGRGKRIRRRSLAELPDGCMIAVNGSAEAVRGDTVLAWSPAGYLGRRPRPSGQVDVLTPPSIVAVLVAGYRPRWHPSADAA